MRVAFAACSDWFGAYALPGILALAALWLSRELDRSPIKLNAPF
jgi:hypothetical protein